MVTAPAQRILGFFGTWVALIVVATFLRIGAGGSKSATNANNATNAKATEAFEAHKRGAAGGGAPRLDPVDDPAYNMREVVKQALLLEQHLADPRKHCRACIVKHLALTCGLLEEAAWMAEGREYPQLPEATALFRGLLDAWPWPRGSFPEALRRIRERRRQLIGAYFAGGGAPRTPAGGFAPRTPHGDATENSCTRCGGG